MKIYKNIIFLLVFLCSLSTAVCAAPEVSEQLDLIADHADIWSLSYDFNLPWGYTVTDLDHNGRYEIISASVQGTGFYTDIKIFEVSEDGTSLNEVEQERPDYDSAPDIMTDRVKVFHDADAGRFYYIFTDMIRNGYAEFYENKRAVRLEDGVWKETALAYKSVLFSDPEHSTESYKDASGAEITEEAYLTAEDDYFKNIQPEEFCPGWQMTDTETFPGITREALRASLEASASPECPERLK